MLSNKNYELAIAWITETIQKPTRDFIISNYERSTDLNYTLSVAMERIKFGCDLEKKVNYERVKKIKDKYERKG